MLNPVEPSEEKWKLVSIFRDVFFIAGDPMLKKDLMRAGADRADVLVILPASYTTQSGVPEYLADYHSLLRHMMKENACRGMKIFPILELRWSKITRLLFPSLF